MGAPHKTTPEQRFWKKVQKTESCWNWTGAVMSQKYPYGNMNIGGHYMQAHRFSFKIHHGEIPEGMRICHRCDNPRCVNPDHLFLGTAKDNSQDMVAKGRARGRVATGEKNPSSKLKEDQVREIREIAARSMTFAQMAKRFNVSESLISSVVKRKSWKHVQ